MMKKIMLVCAFGMSTSMLVKRMIKASEENGKDYEINAESLEVVLANGTDADVLMLAPQVRYAEGKMAEAFPDKTVVSIEMRTYGLMDGAAVIKAAEDAYNAKNS